MHPRSRIPRHTWPGGGRRSRRRSRLVVAATALALTTTPATAMSPTAATDDGERLATTGLDRDDPRAEIEHRLTTRFAKDSTQDFWIRLAADADTSDASEARTWKAQGQRVVDELRQTARTAQADVRAVLDAADVPYEAFWITNAIWVEQGSRALARRIAGLDEVAELRAPTRYAIPEPVRSKPARAVADGVEWGVANINADDVWSQYDDRGDGIVVASIDSGVQFDHPALVASYRGNNGDGTFTHDYNWFDSSNSCNDRPCDSDADSSHGTHTMGTMVGDDGAGNQIGVAPGVTWITANGCAVCSEADLLESSQWMLAPTRTDGSDPDPAKRPDIINNSWGSTAPSTAPLLEDAQQAWADAGIFAVWANGNDGEMGCQSSGSPGSRTLNYSVGAYDVDNTIASFSGRGPGQDGEIKPNISAPGVSVRSAQSGDAYRLLSGTSMAAPHTSGAVALLWSEYPELRRDLDATRALLDLGAIDTPDEQCGGTAADNNVYGEGRLDALALVELGANGIGTLTGRITDADSDDPIRYATVTATGSVERSATTDADGHYTLNLPPGDYDLTVESFGYETRTEPTTITKNATTQTDLALQAVPSVTVEGTVTEGSAHGWPLYATLAVAGMPGGTFHTDPITGGYSLTLPMDGSYDVTFDAVYPGIDEHTETITSGDSDQVVDVELAADPYACTAPGYQPAQSQVQYEQTFDQPTTPADWTVVDNQGNGQVWRFDDERGFGNRTGGDGPYGWVFSSGYGEGQTQDTALVSPVFDLSSTSTPAVWFNTDYSDGPRSTADVDVSVDGGQTWANVWRQTRPSIDESRIQVPIPQAAGEPDVRFRFHYVASYSGWWMVDNAAIGERVCEPVDGGLLAGHVRDPNTDQPLVGATVRGTGQADLATSTRATPDDPALDDGFYWMFAPLTGTHDFTASMTRYQTDSRSVEVGEDAMTQVDFAPAAGLLTVDRESIDASLDLGGSTTDDVVLRNDGTAPTTVDLAETPRGAELLSADGRTTALESNAPGAPVRRVRGLVEPVPAAARDGLAGDTEFGTTALPWTPVADYPTNVRYNVAAYRDGTVYSLGGYTSGTSREAYAYDPMNRAWTPIANSPRVRGKPAAEFVGSRLYVVGGFSGAGQVRADMYVYDPRGDTWTQGQALPSAIAAPGSAVLDNRLYLVGGCRSSCGQRDVMRYDPATRHWETVADYPEPTAWTSCAAIDGLLYCAGGVSDNGGSAATRTYSYDPATDGWTRRADLPIDLWGSAYTASDGRLLLSGGVTDDSHAITNEGFAYDPATDTWSALPNANYPTYSGGSACGFYKIGGSTGGDGTALVEELPGYAACDTADPVPWLSTDPTSVTLEPGEEVTATVAIDTSPIDQPGTYAAALALRDDSPYRTALVEVTVDVAPPDDWGKLAGTIRGLDCAGAIRRLPAATVQVDGRTGSHTLTTDASGDYALWLDDDAGRVDLTAAKSGWFPDSGTARIRAGTTTTRNLRLTATGCEETS